MEFPIKIREAQQSDIDQICLIQESISNTLEIMNREIIEERIRNHAGTFLLASLDDQGIAYITATTPPIPSLENGCLRSEMRNSLVRTQSSLKI